MLLQKANLRTKNETIKKSNWDDQRGERGNLLLKTNSKAIHLANELFI